MTEAVGAPAYRYYPGWPPDPVASPDHYRGLLIRRLFGYWLDLFILAILLVLANFAFAFLVVLSLGLLLPLHVLLSLLVTFGYHSFQLASPSGATLGMRVFGVRAWTLGGEIPSLGQAFIHTLLLYFILGFGGGILNLVALFSPVRRCLHDLGAGILFLRAI